VVSHVLIVANQTLGGQYLIDAIRERHDRGACVFTIVVPAVPPPRDFGANFGSTFVAGGSLGPPTYDSGRTDAARRLEVGLRSVRALGAKVDGEVGVENVMDAVGECLKVRSFDEIIVSTLPPGVSRWLHLDVPHRLQHRFSVPVTTIIAKKGE
jgi:hypothetical protein